MAKVLRPVASLELSQKPSFSASFACSRRWRQAPVGLRGKAPGVPRDVYECLHQVCQLVNELVLLRVGHVEGAEFGSVFLQFGVRDRRRAADLGRSHALPTAVVASSSRFRKLPRAQLAASRRAGITAPACVARVSNRLRSAVVGSLRRWFHHGFGQAPKFLRAILTLR